MQLTVASRRRAPRRIASLFGRLARDRQANSLIEFAAALPLLLTLCLYGVELANMAITNMQVSQIAMAVADNASRLGQTDNSAVAPSVTNADVDSVMTGAMKQGASINFQTNGRIILSSLERHSNGRQYIHWQKCRGNLVQTSAYGPALYGLSGATIVGLGKPTKTISANSNSAVMFVEAFYSYKPLFGAMFVKNVKFSQEAAFMIRDDRALREGETLAVTGPAGSSECT